jgi:hypothetical protein
MHRLLRLISRRHRELRSSEFRSPARKERQLWELAGSVDRVLAGTGLAKAAAMCGLVAALGHLFRAVLC